MQLCLSKVLISTKQNPTCVNPKRMLTSQHVSGTDGISWNRSSKECHRSLWQGSIYKKMHFHLLSTCMHLERQWPAKPYRWEFLEWWSILQRKQGTFYYLLTFILHFGLKIRGNTNKIQMYTFNKIMLIPNHWLYILDSLMLR